MGLGERVVREKRQKEESLGRAMQNMVEKKRVWHSNAYELGGNEGGSEKGDKRGSGKKGGLVKSTE